MTVTSWRSALNVRANVLPDLPDADHDDAHPRILTHIDAGPPTVLLQAQRALSSGVDATVRSSGHQVVMPAGTVGGGRSAAEAEPAGTPPPYERCGRRRASTLSGRAADGARTGWNPRAHSASPTA
jgi:hypothetical protein